MAAPAYELRRDLRLTHAPNGAVLTQPTTGKSYPVTAEEGWVMHSLGEHQGSLAAVSALAKTKGLALSHQDLQALVRQLVERQLLVERKATSLATTVPYETSAVAPTAESPAHQGQALSARTAEVAPHTAGLAEPITSFHVTGGALAPSAVLPAFRVDLLVKRKSKGLYQVKDPRSATETTVYDFEVSLARMLDGRRTAAEVVANGFRLNLPVSLETLGLFVRRLETLGFLLPRGLFPPELKGAPTGTWAPREEWDPEVRELFQNGLKLVNQGRPADAVPLFESVLEVDSHNVEAMEVLARLAEPATAPPASSPSRPPSKVERAPASSAPSRSKRRTWALAVLTGLALMGVGALGSWVLLSFQGSRAVPPVAVEVARPAPPPLVPPTAPPSPAPTRWTSASAVLGPLTAGPVAAPGAGRLMLEPSTTNVVAAGATLGTLQLSPTSLRTALIDAKRAVATLERQRPPLREALARARADLKRLLKDKGRLPLTAPVAGRFVPDPRLTPTVTNGQTVGRMVDPTAWTVEATFDGAPEPGASCLLQGQTDDERALCVIVGASATATGAKVTAQLPAANAPWVEQDSAVRLVLTAAGAP